MVSHPRSNLVYRIRREYLMRRLFVSASLAVFCLTFAIMAVDAADKEKPKDTEKAAVTRKALETKIKEFKVKDDMLAQELEKFIPDLVKEAGGSDIKVKLDSLVTGLTRNQKLKGYTGKDKTLAEHLTELGKNNGIGFLVVNGKWLKFSKKDDDGLLLITKGEHRGYPDEK